MRHCKVTESHENRLQNWLLRKVFVYLCSDSWIPADIYFLQLRSHKKCAAVDEMNNYNLRRLMTFVDNNMC